MTEFQQLQETAGIKEPETSEDTKQSKQKTLKQLTLELKRLEKRQLKEKQQLETQIARKAQLEQNKIMRSRRNKKIYDYGALIPTVFGTEQFDKLTETAEFKELFVCLLINMKQRLEDSQEDQINRKELLKKDIQVGREFLIDLANKKAEKDKKNKEQLTKYELKSEDINAPDQTDEIESNTKIRSVYLDNFEYK